MASPGERSNATVIALKLHMHHREEVWCDSLLTCLACSYCMWFYMMTVSISIHHQKLSPPGIVKLTIHSQPGSIPCSKWNQTDRIITSFFTRLIASKQLFQGPKLNLARRMRWKRRSHKKSGILMSGWLAAPSSRMSWLYLCRGKCVEAWCNAENCLAG